VTATGAAQFDVAIIHFPYVEREGRKKRPAVVVSSQAANAATGVAIVAMVTRESAPPWHGDIVVKHHDSAGLHKPCKIRMKLHTVEVAQLDPVGRLHAEDRKALAGGLKELLAL
jgi:mRNA interferase MazF